MAAATARPMVGAVLNSISREMGDGYAFEYGYELEPRPATVGAADRPETDAISADGTEAEAEDDAPVDEATPTT